MIKNAIKSSLPGIQRVIKPNDLYRHYKGNVYKVDLIAAHTETEEDLVVYRDIKFPEKKPWARPLSMFNDYVIIDNESNQQEHKLRFERILYI